MSDQKTETKTEKKFFPFDDVYKASHAMMNFEMDKARKILDASRKFCPMAQLLYGETYNITSWATQNRKDKENVIILVSTAETTAAEYSNSDNKLFDYIKKRCNVTQITKRELMNWKAYMKIIQADAILSRAINQLQINQYVRAAWNMKTCWQIYSGLLKTHTDKDGNMTLHPEIHEHLKFGVGLFYYIVSLVPGVMLKILQMIGFVGDSDKAITYMAEIYQGGGLKSPYAAIILMAVYLFLPSALSDMHENLKKVEPIIEFCRKTYPNGAMFNYLCAQYARKNGNGKQAVEYLDMAIKACREVQIEPNLFMWDLANAHLMCLEWKPAIATLESIIDSTGKKKAFEFNSICTLQLACAYNMLGDEKKAVEKLKQVKNFVTNKGRFDRMALRKADAILASQDMKSAMSSATFELLYFKRDIAHMMSEHLEMVQKQMEKISSQFDFGKLDLKKTNPEILVNVASTLVIEGGVWNGLKNKDNARKCFEKVLLLESALPALSGRHWVVGALYELGEMSFREGKLEEANEFILRASKYTNYDWEDVYKSRLSKARHQLKKALEQKGVKVDFKEEQFVSENPEDMEDQPGPEDGKK